MSFQKEAVRQIEGFDGRSLVVMDMGLGKTITSLAWCKQKNIKKILVVCPSTIKFVWESEAEKHFKWKTTILNGRKPYQFKPEKLTVINYDILKDWVSTLHSMGFEAVIFDESHALKSNKSARTKASRLLCSRFAYVLMLTGTPISNRPADIWPSLNMLRPDDWGSFWNFAEEFCDLKETRWGWEHKGATNLDDLYELLKSNCVVRYRREDVLKDLPDKTRQIVPLDIDHEDIFKEEYAKLSKMRDDDFKKKVQINKLKKLSAQFKIRSAANWIDGFLVTTDQKLLLFAWHKGCINALTSKYNKQIVKIDGKTRQSQRKISVDKFNNDPKTRLMICNIQAGGVGWSCTSTSHTAFLEFSWRPADMLQAEARTIGIGRGTGAKPIYYYLVGKNTLDLTLCRSLHRKQSQIEQAIDGEIKDTLDLKSEILREFS